MPPYLAESGVLGGKHLLPLRIIQIAEEPIQIDVVRQLIDHRIEVHEPVHADPEINAIVFNDGILAQHRRLRTDMGEFEYLGAANIVHSEYGIERPDNRSQPTGTQGQTFDDLGPGNSVAACVPRRR